jgi:hypothetical protein
MSGTFARYYASEMPPQKVCDAHRTCEVISPVLHDAIVGIARNAIGLAV